MVKQAKQLKCDVNSKQFRDALRLVWIPRLVERIHAAAAAAASAPSISSQTPSSSSHSSLQPSSLSYHSHHSMMNPADINNTHSYSNHSAQQQSTASAHIIQYSELQPFEPPNAADLWTDENIWFLQQQLADDSSSS